MTEKYAFGSVMYDANKIAPDSDRKVLCLTVTKKGLANFVLGYWDGERWVSGMNSNVTAWVDLPDPEVLMKKLTEEGSNEMDHDRQAGQPNIGDAGVRSRRHGH